MKLNKLIEITAYAVGGVSLFLASFLVFALAAGVPANEVALLGGMFPAPEAPAEEPAEGEAGRPKFVAKTPEQLIAESIGRIPTFAGPSPFEDGEVDELVGKLERLVLENTQRDEALDAREAELDERQAAQDEKAALLQGLQESLDVQRGELELTRQELSRDQAVADEREAEKFKKIAAVFGSKTSDATIMATRLSAYPAEDAARILANIEEKRRTELLNALDADSFTAFVDAYAALGY